MVNISVGDGGAVLEFEDLGRLRNIAGQLCALVEEDEAMDVEGVLTQAEEANAMDPIG